MHLNEKVPKNFKNTYFKNIYMYVCMYKYILYVCVYIYMCMVCMYIKKICIIISTKYK